MSDALPSTEGSLPLTKSISSVNMGLGQDPAALITHITQLNEKAWELRSLDSKQASQIAEQALQLALSISYQTGECDALLARGFARFRLGQFEVAGQDAEKARTLGESLEDKQRQLKALNLLGMVHGQTGNLEKALETFLSNRQLLHELGDTKGEANAINNAAFAYALLGDYPNALELYLKALKLFESITYQEGITRSLMNIGSTYLEMKDFQEALPYFLRSLDSKGTREPQVHVTILSNIGYCHEALGDLEKAFGYVLEALHIAESIEDRSGTAATLDSLGRLYLKTGNLTQASESLSHALSIKKNIGDRSNQADTLLLIGDLSLAQGDYLNALEIFQEALNLSSDIGHKPEMAQSHEKLSFTLEKLQHFEQALDHLKSVLKLKNEIYDDASNRKLQSLRVTFQIEHAEKEREIYRLKNVELAKANAQLQHANQEKSDLLEQLARQAQEDALTGLYNRRYFDTRMKLEFQHAKHLNLPLSVMMCDIDNFKFINDTFSHQVGDLVLTKVAEIFKNGLREADVLARYGGEEFVLLMPTTVLDNAVKLCDRLRQSIAMYPWQDIHADLKVTISMGVANDPSCINYEKLIAQADLKLYEAKRSGKNRVCR